MSGAAAGRRRTGYLVIADISGYTKFIAGTELEHAQSIIEDLIAVVRGCLAPPMRFIKLEGDAVFCCADDPLFSHAERLIELAEVCYLQFDLRRREMARATSCTCAACASIESLDLKLVAHRGTYLIDRIGGDVAGPDVILVHRLLKNTIDGQGYVFLTSPCVETLPAPLAGRPHEETVEEFGVVSGVVYRLAPVLEGQRVSAAPHVGPEDADFEHVRRFDAPLPVLWLYHSDSAKRLLWQDLRASRDVPNEDGRLAAGAVTHCDHGSWSSEQRYVDWRPFRSVTTDLVPHGTSFSTPPPLLATTEFSSDGDGAAVATRFRLHDRGRWARTQLRLFAPLIRRDLERQARRLEALLAEHAEDIES